MLSALQMSHQLLGDLITRFPHGNFVDATLGKGFDIEFILKHPHFDGHVYGFDIQEDAINLTKNRLAPLHMEDRYDLIHDSHSTIDKYLTDDCLLHGAIFNLGYLPGGDHAITTLPHTTIEAIEQIIPRLVIGSSILLVLYWGHSQGKVEKEALFDYLSDLPQELVTVMTYHSINQKNEPPIILVIEKR